MNTLDFTNLVNTGDRREGDISRRAVVPTIALVAGTMGGVLAAEKATEEDGAVCYEETVAELMEAYKPHLKQLLQKASVDSQLYTTPTSQFEVIQEMAQDKSFQHLPSDLKKIIPYAPMGLSAYRRNFKGYGQAQGLWQFSDIDAQQFRLKGKNYDPLSLKISTRRALEQLDTRCAEIMSDPHFGMLCKDVDKENQEILLTFGALISLHHPMDQVTNDALKRMVEGKYRQRDGRSLAFELAQACRAIDRKGLSDKSKYLMTALPFAAEALYRLHRSPEIPERRPAALQTTVKGLIGALVGSVGGFVGESALAAAPARKKEDASLVSRRGFLTGLGAILGAAGTGTIPPLIKSKPISSADVPIDRLL